MVASGEATTVRLAGLRFGERLLEQAALHGRMVGVRVSALWTSTDEGPVGLIVEAGVVPALDGSILLVEDDDALRRILAGHLRRHGYDVIEVDSAEGAVEHLDSAPPPALVLLDINLPGGTGWDVLRSPVMQAAGRPPVVVASAVTVSPRHLAEFGVEGYLPKPFPLETLLQTVERLLGDAAQQTESPNE